MGGPFLVLIGSASGMGFRAWSAVMMRLMSALALLLLVFWFLQLTLTVRHYGWAGAWASLWEDPPDQI